MPRDGGIIADTQASDCADKRVFVTHYVERPPSATAWHKANPLPADHNVETALEHRAHLAARALAERTRRANADRADVKGADGGPGAGFRGCGFCHADTIRHIARAQQRECTAVTAQGAKPKSRRVRLPSRAPRQRDDRVPERRAPYARLAPYERCPRVRIPATRI